MKNEDNIDILYQIINNMQKLNIPIAIKGGLLLKASLKEHQSNIDRQTTDIDGNWLKQTPNMEEMRKDIEKAVHMSYPDYEVKIKRPYGERQSAGFSIMKNHSMLAHIDIDVNKITPTKLYMINNIQFHGIPIEQVLCDKISVLSSPQIMRRTKDLLDIYAITKSIPYDKQTLTELLSKRKLDNFSTLYTQKENIQHAYEKLKGVTNKPDFQQVYDSVISYCKDITNTLASQKEKHLTITLPENTTYDDNLEFALAEKASQQNKVQNTDPSLKKFKANIKPVSYEPSRQKDNPDGPKL